MPRLSMMETWLVLGAETCGVPFFGLAMTDNEALEVA
jgi:hypothetical protein